MSLLLEHSGYIEFLKKEYFSNLWKEAVNCRTECMFPKVKNLLFGFTSEGVKKMYVMDTLNNLKEEL